MVGPVGPTDNARTKRKREIETYTKSHPRTSTAINESRLMVERSAMTRAIAVVPSPPNNNLVAVPRKSAAKCWRRAARSSPSTIVASSSSQEGSLNHQSAIKLSTLSAAAAITNERVSARPRCAPVLDRGGGTGRRAMYSYSAMLCVSSGDRFELPLAGELGRVMLIMSGGGSGLVGKRAPCGLYASSVHIRSGIQNARRTGMTSVQQAVRRRKIPGAITCIVLRYRIYSY
jgi:hypothetical protein